MIQASFLAFNLSDTSVAGQTPFMDRDWNRPNPRYWAHVDSVLTLAEQAGVYMAVSPAWAGAHIDLRTEARDGRIPLSTEDACRYARLLGARYDSRKNLIWLLGGDVRPTRHDAHDAIAKGLADHYVQQHGGTSKLMGFLTGYPCCAVNMHQGWPKLVHHLWMASADGGLAALVYGPSRLSTQLGGVAVSIEERTDYPFGDVVQFLVDPERAVQFPLHLRVPSWANGASLRVNGRPHPLARPGQVTRIARTWRAGDRVELRLPPRVEISRWHKGLAGVERGPLVYALPIGEEWRRVGEAGGVATHEVHPTSAWNYALDIRAPIRVAHTAPVGARPWRPDAAPVTLTAQVRRVEGWKNYHHVYGTLPSSPVATDAPAE